MVDSRHGSETDQLIVGDHSTTIEAGPASWGLTAAATDLQRGELDYEDTGNRGYDDGGYDDGGSYGGGGAAGATPKTTPATTTIATRSRTDGTFDQTESRRRVLRRERGAPALPRLIRLVTVGGVRETGKGDHDAID